jgi:hypothetical protein
MKYKNKRVHSFMRKKKKYSFKGRETFCFKKLNGNQLDQIASEILWEWEL